MKDYKISDNRLARFFEKSRDQWRARAAEKQKKLRALETQVRDLERSRVRWKERALQAEQAIVEDESSKDSEDNDSKDNGKDVLVGKYLARGELSSEERVRGHNYSLGWIEWSLLQILIGLSSLHGTCRMLAKLGDADEGTQTPVISTVRSWLFRIGLSVIQQPVPRHDDWIVILDMTVELGTAKVLAIVGLPQKRLQTLSKREQGCCLGHHDVQWLGLEILEHSNGDIIADCLEKLEGRIGRIQQIVADHGSDLKCGIERYQKRRNEVRSTYDVTHQVALWLKHALENDATYCGFRNHCQESVQKLQQTSLHFLKPPTPRKKTRWHQISAQIEWASKMLTYYDRGRFEELAQGYRLDEHTQDRLIGVLSKAQRYRLNHRVWCDYDDEAGYLNALRRHLGEEAVETHRRALCHAGHLGRRQFEEHLGWLPEYREAIKDYAQRIAEVEKFQHQLKHDGLMANATESLTKEIASPNPALQTLRTNMQTYLNRESTGIAEGKVWLASSDVLESLFGKYKLFSQRSPLKEVSRWVLILPLLTIKLSRELIRQALESVSTQKLELWVAEHFGPSAFSRRKAAFGVPKKT